MRPRAVLAVALAALALGGPIAWGAWERLGSRSPPALGRAPDLRPATPPAAAARFDARGATIGARFAPPAGWERVPAPPGSYAAWLRALQLRPDGAPVRLHTGRWKARQDVHAAVLARDPGPRDLQQCADAAIRLRAEYLHAVGRGDDVAFHFTSGFPCAFREWRQGRRVAVDGTRVRWVPGGDVDASEAALARYLDVVFTYAGTASLPRDVEPVPAGTPPAPGDLYLKPGSPGHAMIVVDVAARGDAHAMLLAQSYMPAQEIHVVRNPAAADGDPWFRVGEGPELVTPEWRFAWSALRRFREAR